MLPTSICSDDARIVFRRYPSGATFVLTHTNLLTDERTDMHRMDMMYEALSMVLGPTMMADALQFNKAKFRVRCR